MTYTELLENARKTILNCKACPECNGLACGNILPGPGSKAPGNGAHDNWRAWQGIRLNVDTFVPDAPVDCSFSLFGRDFRLPLLTGPIGSMRQYSKSDCTVAFNDAVFEAAAACGIIATYGDGLAEEVLPEGLRSLERHGAAVIPVLNPISDEGLMANLELIQPTDALAVAVVVDSAGLSHWKGSAKAAGSKTVEQLRALKAHTDKPFVIKGILSARAAEQAVEAGADAIIVSNHGGRVLPYAPPTAEVLPEIAAAVGGQTKIIVDGGIRSGADMLKALALGADAVLICRPFAVSWFGGGSEGVRFYIEKLYTEFAEAMYMCGARKLSDISSDMVRL